MMSQAEIAVKTGVMCESLEDQHTNEKGSATEPSAARELALEINVDAIVQPLEELRVVRGLCFWTDVATAIGEIRRSLRSLSPSACKTCNGHGIIGGMYRVGDGDVDGWEKPCPECEPSTARELALEQIRSFNPREEVEAYEFRGDNGDHTPSEAEKVMLEDFAAGLLGRIEDAVFSRAPGGSTNDE